MREEEGLSHRLAQLTKCFRDHETILGRQRIINPRHPRCPLSSAILTIVGLLLARKGGEWNRLLLEEVDAFPER